MIALFRHPECRMHRDILHIAGKISWGYGSNPTVGFLRFLFQVLSRCRKTRTTRLAGIFSRTLHSLSCCVSLESLDYSNLFFSIVHSSKISQHAIRLLKYIFPNNCCKWPQREYGPCFPATFRWVEKLTNLRLMHIFYALSTSQRRIAPVRSLHLIPEAMDVASRDNATLDTTVAYPVVVVSKGSEYSATPIGSPVWTDQNTNMPVWIFRYILSDSFPV